MLLHENRAEFLTCNMLRAICKYFDYELCGLSYISNYACCPPLCASPHKRHVALIEKKLITPNWYWIIICAAKHIVNVNDGHRVVFPCMPLIINVIKHTHNKAENSFRGSWSIILINCVWMTLDKFPICLAKRNDYARWEKIARFFSGRAFINFSWRIFLLLARRPRFDLYHYKYWWLKCRGSS